MASKVLSLRDYKLAKVFVRDITVIIRSIDKALRDFEPYSRYKPAKAIIEELKNNKSILEAHYVRYKKIADSKGLISQEDSGGKN